MNTRDQRKVIIAGFTLIRAGDYPSPRIKIKDGKSCEWRTMRKFDTKAERDREMKKLLELNMVIED